jgi:methyl-accepting chemotaxis protein
MSSANKIMVTGIVVTLIAILLAALIGLMLGKRFTKPLIHLTDATARLAQGDLTAKVDVNSRDELGQLAEAFNLMMDNLKTLICGVMSTSEHLAASAEELTATSTEAGRAISQISGTVNEFAQGAQQQTVDVNDMASIVGELTRSAQQVSEKAQTASALSREMAQAAQAGEEATGNAIRNINEIKLVTQDTSDAVSSLGVKSQQIGQIVDAITGIAGQTNLLALNAAIEAARAGEQGRGFAVVADEVRKLAEQSEQAAREIGGIIREIQEQTDHAIVAMEEGSTKVNTGVQVVQTAGDTLTSILNKVENSVQAMGDIAASVEQQVIGTSNVAASTERIAVIARQSSVNAEHTAAATQEISASMGEISSAAQELAVAASELQTMVAKFRI